MGAPYQSQAVSGYNASPPSDDGSQTSTNKITWNSTIKTKLSDPLNVFIAAVNSQLVTWSDFSSATTSTNLTTTTAHHMQTIEVTSGSPTIQLGDAATMTKNYTVTVTNTGTGAPVIALATAGNTLDGTAAGTFTFPTGTHTSFTFKVNNGATGYYTEKNGGKTIQAVTSVLTPIIDSGSSGALSLLTNNGQTGLKVANNGASANGFLFTPGASGGNGSFFDNNNSGDTNVTLFISAKGTGGHTFRTDVAGTAPTQFQVLHTASATRNITITGSNGGNPTIGATAGSPAITYASAGGSGTPTSHTLNMYEEGTWTPSLGGNTTYNQQVGFYTKVGRFVCLNFNINVALIGTGSTVAITGVPFASMTTASDNAGSVTTFSNLATSVTSLGLRLPSSSSTITVRSLTAAATSDGTSAIFANNAIVSGTISYFTT